MRRDILPQARAAADAVRRRPHDPDGWARLGALAEGEGRLEAAGLFLAKAVAAAPAGSPGRVRRRYEEQRFWARRLAALLRDRRFAEAFAVGERLLASEPFAEVWEILLSPVDPAQTGFDARLLCRILEALRRAPSLRAPWRLHLRVVLLRQLGWTEQALRESEGLAALPARYAWMRYNRGLLLHHARWDYDGAAAEFAAASAAAPSFWKARAALAEVELCRGRAARALALMDACVRDLRGAPLPHDRAAAVVWRGEMQLWRGRYRRALADFEAGTREGAPLAACWRGAARLLLGRTEAALADLDAALRADPRDAEALTWRAEARLRAGDLDGARADADGALRLHAGLMWPRVTRALVHARRGDEAAFRDDYAALRPQVVALFEGRLGLDGGRNMADGARVLEAILAAAKGIRRADAYLSPLWLDP